MKKRKQTFFGTAFFATAAVGAIALGVWFVHAFVERYLSAPHTFSGVTITPYGHNTQSLLEHSFDSLFISTDSTEVKIINPNLDITILGENRGVSLKMDHVDAFIAIPQSDTLSATKIPPTLHSPTTLDSRQTFQSTSRTQTSGCPTESPGTPRGSAYRTTGNTRST